jgi:hypothetical protein
MFRSDAHGLINVFRMHITINRLCLLTETVQSLHFQLLILVLETASPSDYRLVLLGIRILLDVP